MASWPQRTWVWVDSRSWWWTGRPGMLWFMGSQIVRHDWVTELNPMISIGIEQWERGHDIFLKGDSSRLSKHLRIIYISYESESCSIVSNSLWPLGLYSPRNSLGQNTGVGSLSLLQVIFSNQGLNPGLLHCRWILYQLSSKGNPRILEWVAYPFSSRSSWPRNWTGVSWIAGRFFTNWAIRGAHASCNGPCTEFKCHGAHQK